MWIMYKGVGNCVNNFVDKKDVENWGFGGSLSHLFIHSNN